MHAAPRSYASIENISPLLQRLHGARIHLICASTLAHTQKKTVALPFWPLCEFSLTKTPQWQVFWQEVESTFAFGCSHFFGSLARLPKRGGAYGWKWSGLFCLPVGHSSQALSTAAGHPKFELIIIINHINYNTSLIMDAWADEVLLSFRSSPFLSSVFHPHTTSIFDWALKPVYL